jgi:hypothetical protein
MVEACYDGKTYYTPMTEKTRVKIKCPAKAKAHNEVGGRCAWAFDNNRPAKSRPSPSHKL